MTALPVDTIIPELRRILTKTPNAVVTTQPGAGKTTRVPLGILNEPWLDNQRIIMLEPRRLAARAAAYRMAATLGEHVGETVGYRIRLDKRIGPHTRIEVVTEGILTRILQSDPSLDGYGLVIFDEFHERNLHADLGLALCLETQTALREELRILVMSATLDTESISSLLGNTPIISCKGTVFPIETRYLSHPPPKITEQPVVQAVKEAVSNCPGNILVFLPGIGEIRRVERGIRNSNVGSHVHVAPLYGDLSQSEQDLAIQPPAPGQRKIVLATNIAETSLTIEGIRIVIDTGLVRVAKFDPRSGMSRLETIKVSKDSADQRQGRAGRIEPGVCFRLWTVREHQGLLQRTTPEILESDLSSLALELAHWGNTDPHKLSWIDPPPRGAYSQAKELLVRLGAIDDEGRITTHGKQMVQLPLHPRLAHMVLEGKRLGLEHLACELAVILSERDFVKSQPGDRNIDLQVRVDVLHHPEKHKQNFSVDRIALKHILKATVHLKKQLDLDSENTDYHKNYSEDVGLLLAFAYPDRIAQCQNRAEGRYRLANGRGAVVSELQALSGEPYLVIAHLDGEQQWARIFLAAPVRTEALEEHCSDQISELQFVKWDDSTLGVSARKQRRLGELILEDQALRHPDPDQVTAALIQGLRQLGIDCLPWTKALRSWQARVLFMRQLEGENSSWPDVGDLHLLDTIDEWLGPFLPGLSRLDQIQRMDIQKPLLSLINWEQRKELDDQAPTHLTVPTGSKILLQYPLNESPVLAVRLQEMFGQWETPRIAGGRVPVLIHLLSPARRPVQVTGDLASFWANSYQEVRKELRGRYPKHHWPEDPLKAKPTTRTKRFQ